MLTLLSPAKTLDWTPAPADLPVTRPLLDKDFTVLMKRCKALDVEALESLMKLSQPLAELNYERFQQMTTSFNKQNSKACLLAFKGDVYRSLDAASLSTDDLIWAQRHLRIISGLYGVLRPLDLMQPYRLEMGTRLDTERGASLYEFWGDRIAKALNEEIDTRPTKAVLDLASNEYSKAVPAGSLDRSKVRATFKEYRNGTLRTIGFYATQARGHGYAFDPDLSTETDLVFTRQQSAN
jgi:cytoplasmic iron level regulating protein YaaA (DUF328/UPF0246 family)